MTFAAINRSLRALLRKVRGRDKKSRVTTHMQNEHPARDRRKLSPAKKVLLYSGFAAGAIVLASVLALLLFSDPLVNTYVKPRITEAFADAYPAYSMRIADMTYSVFKNSFGFDSVAVSAADGKFSGTMDSFSVSGISWIHLLWGGTLGQKDVADVDLQGQDIELKFPKSQTELRCRRLHISAPDSEMVVESLELHPLGGDDRFFAGSAFRKARLSLVTTRCTVTGLACLELLQGKMYRARSVQIHNAFLDILLNKDKPDSKDTSGPFMPNEILSSIKETLQIDRLKIVNGRLKYGERFDVGAKPAWITFDSVRVLAEGIANHGGRDAAIVIHAQGNFVQAATMNLLLSIPVGSKEFSFQYSGSLGRMDLEALNSFLETSDQMRIKEGVLQGVTFAINVVSGRASGSVWGVYKDLSLAAITKETGSEKGLSNAIVSFIANTFKVNEDNVPDKSGSIRVGVVKYTRQPDDPFVQFMWFALRTGVRNVVGF